MKSKQRLIRLINIPKISDDCYLCFAQNPTHIPFSIKRIFYILQAQLGLPRGAHAHYKTEQILFCIQGSIKMVLDNGKRREEIILDQPEVGIFLDKMIWHEMQEFKKDTILLVIASRKYNNKDYIRSYRQFLGLVNSAN